MIVSNNGTTGDIVYSNYVGTSYFIGELENTSKQDCLANVIKNSIIVYPMEYILNENIDAFKQRC